MKNSKISKPFTFFILIIIIMAFSPILVRGATALSNPTRTPSLEGDVDYDYDSDYTCDYTLQIDFPPRSVSYFRLYYRINAGGWSYFNMEVLDANTYKLDDCSPDDMGAIPGDDIDYYFYIKDSDNDEDTTATYSFSVNQDLIPPAISNLADDADYIEEFDDVEFSATITDAGGMNGATLYWKAIGSDDGWDDDYIADVSGDAMSPDGDVYSYTETDTWEYDDNDYQYWILSTDTSTNYGGCWYGNNQEGDAVDWNEGAVEASVNTFGHSSLVYTGTTIKAYHNTANYYIGMYFRPFNSFGDRVDCTDYDGVVIRFRVVKESAGSREYRMYYGVSDDDSDYWNHDTSSGYFYNIDNSDGWITMFWKFPRTGGQVTNWDLIERMRVTIATEDAQVFEDAGDYFEFDHLWIVRTGVLTVYDWDVPSYGGTTEIDPATNIENDDSVTISNSALSDAVSGYTSGNAKVYYFDDDGIWGTETMTGTSPATANIGTFDYDDTITYAFEVMDDAGIYRYYQQDGTEINENSDGWVNNIHFSSVTHTQDTNNDAYMKCTTMARTEGGAYFRMTRTGWSVDTNDYYWFFMRWKVSTTDYEWKFYGIRDDDPQYTSHHNSADNYYQNWYIDGNDGWVTTYGMIDPDLREVETEIELVFTPKLYPNQNVDAGEYIMIDYFYLVNPDEFTIIDITDPDIDTPTHSPTTPLDTQDVTLYCDASDTASGVDYVICAYRVDGGDFVGDGMSGSGTYSCNIGSFNYDEYVEYYFRVYDNAGNDRILNNGGSYYSFTCEDTEDPVISGTDFNPDYPKETDSVTISATITDNDNVASAYVYYRINGGDWNNHLMSEGGSNVWSKDMETFDIDDTIEFYIQTTDDYGNVEVDNNSGSYYTIEVTDQETPSLTNLDHSPEVPDCTDDITISVTISDNDDVTHAYLLWRVNGGNLNNDSMSEGGANVWSKNIGTLNDLDFLEYYVQAFDPSGNVIFSNDYATTELSDSWDFAEHDSDDWVAYYLCGLTEIINGYQDIYHTSDVADYFSMYSLTNLGLDSDYYNTLILRAKVSNVEEGVNWRPMLAYYTPDFDYQPPYDYDLTETWDIFIFNSEAGKTIDRIRFYITNWEDDAESDVDFQFDYVFLIAPNNVTVEDVENPSINDDFMDGWNDTIDFNWGWDGGVSITDNVEIDTVLLYYRINSGSWIAVGLEWSHGTYWGYNMTLYYGSAEYGDYLWMRVWANDTSDNTFNSRWCWAYFQDETNPEISDISNTPENPLRLQDVTINCTVVDNGVISHVTVYWRIDDGEWFSANMTNYSGDLFSYIIGSFAINEVIDYYIKAWDTYDNYDTSSTYEIDLTDDVNPVVVTPVDDPYNDYFLNETSNACDFTEGYEGFTFTYGQSWEAGVVKLNPNDENFIYMNKTMTFNSDVYYILTVRAKKGALGGVLTWLKIGTTHIGSLTTSYQTFELDMRGTWTGWQSFLCLNAWDNLGLATIYIDWIETKTTHIVEDYSFESSNIYYYNVTDLNAKEYEVFRNATTYQSGAWISGVNIQLTITDNINSVYNFTAIFTDWASNTVILTILIITLDETTPTISNIYHNPNTPDEKQSISIFVTLTDNDDVTYAYLIWRINVGSWTNNSLSEGGSNIWSYAIGLHSINDDIDYYIQARDPNNNQDTDDNSGSYYNVVVTDQETPVITSPDNVEYIREHTGYSISWVVTDNHHGTFIIYLDGVSVNSSSWTSGSTITISVDNLIEGEHNYTISLQDDTGNLVTDYVLVTVNQKPVITEDPIIPEPPTIPITPPPLVIIDTPKPVAWGAVGLLLLTSASLLLIRIRRSREKKKKGSDYD